MPVLKHLDVSSATVTEEDFAAAQAGFPGLDGAPRTVPHDFGVWLQAADPEQLTQEFMSSHPSAAAVISYAFAHGCAWINLDQDAPPEPGLPHYGW